MFGKELSYRAKVEAQGKDNKIYFGLTSNTFNRRYMGHMHTFKASYLAKDTSMSEYVWKLKSEDTDYNIQ